MSNEKPWYRRGGFWASLAGTAVMTLGAIAVGKEWDAIGELLGGTPATNWLLGLCFFLLLALIAIRLLKLHAELATLRAQARLIQGLQNFQGGHEREHKIAEMADPPEFLEAPERLWENEDFRGACAEQMTPILKLAMKTAAVKARAAQGDVVELAKRTAALEEWREQVEHAKSGLRAQTSVNASNIDKLWARPERWKRMIPDREGVRRLAERIAILRLLVDRSLPTKKLPPFTKDEIQRQILGSDRTASLIDMAKEADSDPELRPLQDLLRIRRDEV